MTESEDAPRQGNNARLKKEVRSWLSVSALLITIWAVISFLSGEPVTFWPAIPIGIWGVFIVISGLGSRSGNTDN